LNGSCRQGRNGVQPFYLGLNPLLQLLLGAQLVGVAALLLAAVDRAGVEASIAPAGKHDRDVRSD